MEIEGTLGQRYGQRPEMKTGRREGAAPWGYSAIA